MAEKWPRDLWLEAIWEDGALKPGERVVAYVFARFAGRDDVAWCSYPEMMRRTGMRDRTTVSTAIKGLTKAGWLDTVAGARQHRSPVYRLVCPLQQSGIPTDQQSGIPTSEASGSAATVGIFGSTRRDFPDQQSGFWDPRKQIEISEENSEHSAPDPSAAPRPSGKTPHAFQSEVPDTDGVTVGAWCLCGLPPANEIHKEPKRHRQEPVRASAFVGPFGPTTSPGATA